MLSAIRTAAAWQRLDALYLFALLLIEGGVAEVDVPVQARVRCFVGRWVWFGCGRVTHAADLLVRSVEPPESSDLAGGDLY